MLSNYMWPVATILDNTDMEYFHCSRKFYWTALQRLGHSENVPRDPFRYGVGVVSEGKWTSLISINMTC